MHIISAGSLFLSSFLSAQKKIVSQQRFGHFFRLSIQSLFCKERKRDNFVTLSGENDNMIG